MKTLERNQAPMSAQDRCRSRITTALSRIYASDHLGRIRQRNTRSACRKSDGLPGRPYFFKNAETKSIGSGRKVVVLCSLAISRIV